MGYRSDVVVTFYTMKPDVVPFIALKVWFDENFPKHDFGTVETGSGYIKVSYDQVKWYAGYPEVQAVNEALNVFTVTFKADDWDNAAWEMVRVGEETADIETDGSAYNQFRLGVNREIVFD